MPSDDDYRRFIDELERARRVLVTTHVRPDGDALGTTAALALALAGRGIEAECLVLSTVPERYRFIYEDAGVKWRELGRGLAEEAVAEHLAGFDALLVCDTGTWNQLPGLAKAAKQWAGAKLVLDHHITQEDWATAKLVDTTAAAAAEVAMELLASWKVPLDQRLADPLYAALATDTGWFAYSNTTSRTLRLAAECLDAGVDPQILHQRLRQSDPPSRLRLWAIGLASLELLDDDRLALLTLRREDYERTGADVEEAEDLVNEPLRIGSVEVSVIFGQSPGIAEEKQPVKVSVRTKGQVDAAALCQRFGGGGHARAAGCRVDGSIEQVKARVVEAVREAMGEGRA